MAKDAWDKLNIVVSNIILVAIPIIIGVVGDNISRSLERGRFIDSLLDDLTTPTAETRRDIALIALDSAIPPPKDESQPDQVVDIAGILLKDTIAGVNQPGGLINRKIETSAAKKIIYKRKPKKGDEIIRAIITESTEAIPAEQKIVKTDKTPGEEKAATDNLKIKREQTAEIISSLLPSDIKLVYIQYEQDNQAAEAIQNYLKDKKIVVPGIEKISSIKQDDIRFSSQSDRKKAEELKVEIENFLKEKQNIKKEFKLIDLSKAGYKVPSGQFEIWLNQ